MPVTINGLDGNPMTGRDIDASPNNFIFSFHKLAFNGSYTTAIGGDTLDLTAIAALIPSSGLPLQIAETLNGGTGSFSKSGGYCEIEIGPTLATCKIKFFSAGGTELGTQTYAAALINLAAENIGISITWRKLL